MRGHLLALVYVCAAVDALAASSSSSSSLAWRRFKSEHAKVYEPEEDAMRFANFLATKQLVERHNADPKATYKMRLNHMADWSREERQQLTGFKHSETQRLERDVSLSPKLAKLLDGPVPKEVDWRKVPNRVSAVKDQGNCTSGWAFATTGLLEGQQAGLNISKLVPLSEQELLDCSQNNGGCFGGVPEWALYDIAFRITGIESEADYPFEARESKCRFDKSKSVMTAKGALFLNKGDEEGLLKAVANYGPVAASIKATNNFFYYGSGVFYDRYCIPKNYYTNHAVLVVGYGTDAHEGDYWIVKNSWGTDWGEEGYMKIKRGINMCSIANFVTLANI